VQVNACTFSIGGIMKCNQCNIDKDSSDFYKTSGRKCKVCVKQKMVEYRKTEAGQAALARSYAKRDPKADAASRREEKAAYYRENKGTLRERYTSYKSGAKQRNYIFTLTKEQFASFWKKPCYYCNDVIETIGLDRIDNDKGYVIDNIISCCTGCNLAKRADTQEDYISRCKRVAAAHA
jgi:hypothetical protein